MDRKTRRQQVKIARHVGASVFFDARWYLETYGDVAADGMNPLWHYLRYGRHEGRRPLPDLA